MNRHDAAAARAIRHAAEAWVVRLQAGADPAERAAFADWLRLSPMHVAEYLAAEAAWQALACGARRRTDDVARLCEAPRPVEPKVVDFHDAMRQRSLHAPSGRGAERRREPSARRRRAAAWSAAAVLAACAAVASAWLLQPVPGQVYATAIGEIRRIPLEDGSTLELNTDSAVKVSFRRDHRDIVLRKGEAFVSVAHDRARPLRILAGGVGVRAVGTAFNVRRREGGLQVTVTDGRVAVGEAPAADRQWQRLLGRLHAGAGNPSHMPAQAPTHVEANQQLDLKLEGPRIAEARISPADAARWLGWRNRQLEFTRERLDAVVAELNRYNRQQIVVRDAALAARRISGGFDPTQPDTLLRFLQLHGDVQVAAAPGGELLIRRIGASAAPKGKNNSR